MPKVYSDSDFSDSGGTGKTYSDSDFSDPSPQDKISGAINSFGDATANTLPMAGMMAGAAASLPYAAAAGPLAPFVPVMGAAIGGMGGQGYKRAYQFATGQGNLPTTGAAVADISGAGQNAALGQMVGMASERPLATIAGAVGPAIEGAALRAGKQLAGIPETIGRYVLGRGARNVLTTENMAPDATANALESAQSFLSSLRSTSASDVKSAEDAIIASGASNKLFNTSEMANSLRAQMANKGLTGSTSGLASGKDVGILNTVQQLLDKGQLTGKELINVKRLLSAAVDYSGGRLPEISNLAEGIVKNVAYGARQITNTAYPGLSTANAQATQAFGLYDKYRKFLGQSDTGPAIKATGDTLRRIRSGFIANPGIPQEIGNDLGGQVANPLFDTIAAQNYTANSPVLISPSSPLLKAMSTLGLTGPQVSGAALRAAQFASKGLTGAAQAGPYFVSPFAAQQLNETPNYSVDPSRDR